MRCWQAVAHQKTAYQHRNAGFEGCLGRCKGYNLAVGGDEIEGTGGRVGLRGAALACAVVTKRNRAGATHKH